MRTGKGDMRIFCVNSNIFMLIGLKGEPLPQLLRQGWKMNV
jgi:hypothetical protein